MDVDVGGDGDLGSGEGAEMAVRVGDRGGEAVGVAAVEVVGEGAVVGVSTSDGPGAPEQPTATMMTVIAPTDPGSMRPQLESAFFMALPYSDLAADSLSPEGSAFSE